MNTRTPEHTNTHQHCWVFWFEGTRFYALRCLHPGCRATTERWKSGIYGANEYELTTEDIQLELATNLTEQHAELN